jgi:RNA polymerase sigma factor (sigma-70 family)
MKDLEHELLIVRCQLGEQAAFDELITRWHPPLWKYARRLAAPDEVAGDVVQETWLRVVRGIGRLRDRERFRAWLFGITRRVMMDRLRGQYAEANHLALDVDVTAIAGADDAFDLQEDLSRHARRDRALTNHRS